MAERTGNGAGDNPAGHGPANLAHARHDQGAAAAVAPPDAHTGGPAVERLAAEVLRYLERYPQAADGIEGIARWWIAKQRLEDTLLQVEQAVESLVARGLVEAVRGGDGRLRYRRVIDAATDAGPDAARGPTPADDGEAH